jgi:alkylhydroperoxidase/carboxymuconolactone decarboxylase family protein YurZ
VDVQGKSGGDAVAHPTDQYEWLAAFDPDFEAARRTLVGVIWEPQRGELPPRIREIVAVVALSFMHYPTVGVHMRRALAAGAKFREIFEALQTVCVPGGHPCLHYAMPYLKEIQAELGEAANEGAASGEHAPVKTGIHALTAWSWMEENYPDYNAARSALTRKVWTPENPVLPVKYREIMAAVILALRFYPTVPNHLRRAIVEGATFREAVEAIQTAALFAGMPVLHFTLPFLKEIQAEVESGKLP